MTQLRSFFVIDRYCSVIIYSRVISAVHHAKTASTSNDTDKRIHAGRGQVALWPIEACISVSILWSSLYYFMLPVVLTSDTSCSS